MINKNNPKHMEGSISQNEHGRYFLGVQMRQGQDLEEPGPPSSAQVQWLLTSCRAPEGLSHLLPRKSWT